MLPYYCAPISFVFLEILMMMTNPARINKTIIPNANQNAVPILLATNNEPTALPKAIKKAAKTANAALNVFSVSLISSNLLLLTPSSLSDY